MQFMHSEEQLAFSEAIDDIVEGIGGTQIARTWGEGDFSLGESLWDQFTELGLNGLLIPEDEGGMGGSLTDLATVFERFGYQGVPGPYVESVAFLPQIVSADDRASLIAGTVGTAAVEDFHPYALDAGIAKLHYSVSTGPDAPASIAPGVPGAALSSISPMRHLSRIKADEQSTQISSHIMGQALHRAMLANAAMLIGAGERLLHEGSEYAKVREQFGRPIGEFQALKHQLADVRVALSFARPLIWSAAISVETEKDTADRDVAAAKIQSADAAKLAAQVALQVLGAIGYTSEHDASIWLKWVQALTSTWGTPAMHRARVAKAILAN